MNLLIISHTEHYQVDGRVYGWGSTVREIDHLAKLFDHVTHLAPLHLESLPKNALAYTAENIQFYFVTPSGGRHIQDKLNIIRIWLEYFQKIQQCMEEADAVHIRCPANISLLAIVMLIFRKSPKIRWIKYAGNWQRYYGEAFSYKVQRWILKRNFSRAAVTINGNWRNQPGHIQSFYNPSLSLQEIIDANEIARNKNITNPIVILFVGRIEAAKGVGRIIEIARKLSESGTQYQIELVGDGQERHFYEELVKKQDLDHAVKFNGWKPHNELAGYYRKSHYCILPSSSEGWPKVLSEAMAHGCVPLANKVSAIPQILSAAGAGITIEAEDTDGYAKAIRMLIGDPDLWKKYSQAGVMAAHLFTYEHYLEKVKRMFLHTWKVDLDQLKM